MTNQALFMAVIIDTAGNTTLAAWPDPRSESVLAHLQAACGGSVDVVSLTTSMSMWVNDEGILLRMEPNPVATRIARLHGAGQPFFGPAVFTGGIDEDVAIAAWSYRNRESTMEHIEKICGGPPVGFWLTPTLSLYVNSGGDRTEQSLNTLASTLFKTYGVGGTFVSDRSVYGPAVITARSERSVDALSLERNQIESLVTSLGSALRNIGLVSEVLQNRDELLLISEMGFRVDTVYELN